MALTNKEKTNLFIKNNGGLEKILAMNTREIRTLMKGVDEKIRQNIRHKRWRSRTYGEEAYSNRYTVYYMKRKKAGHVRKSKSKKEK